MNLFVTVPLSLWMSEDLFHLVGLKFFDIADTNSVYVKVVGFVSQVEDSG